MAVFQNQEDKKVLTQLDSAPHQIWTTTPWYLWNIHLTFLNEYIGQTNFIQRYAETKCLKILVVYKQGVRKNWPHTHPQRCVEEYSSPCYLFFITAWYVTGRKSWNLFSTFTQLLLNITTCMVHTLLLIIKQSINPSEYNHMPCCQKHVFNAALTITPNKKLCPIRCSFTLQREESHMEPSLDHMVGGPWH